MKVLVIGSGGKEHAICWKLKESPIVTELLCAPGNGGISKIARCFADIAETDIKGILTLAKRENVDFVVVANDMALSLGLVDKLDEAGIPAFGPVANAARMEASKIFSKNLMKKYGIPTARYECFDDCKSAMDYLRTQKMPIVIKADGLALGRGVVIAKNIEEAEDAVSGMMLEKVFGESGSQIVVEECLSGREVTLLCFTDGDSIVTMPSAQDHKRAFDGDKGPNTGGMGAFSPSVIYTDEIAVEVYREILLPTLAAMKGEGILFKGVLYVGLMLTDSGAKVVEYNARFGDPEAQAVLPLLNSDLMEIFLAVQAGKLGGICIDWKKDVAAACVCMASGGYPMKYETGKVISGIAAAEATGAIVFHAGTKDNKGVLTTNGGRVLCITSVASDLTTAIDAAYIGAEKIAFERQHYRRDIGKLDGLR